MATYTAPSLGRGFIFLLSLWTSVSTSASSCPEDYRYRVETCVMEAQVAPQAGGGLPLITNKDKLEELCQRGILQKTIDCLQDIYVRCTDQPSVKNELDMLFSIPDWRQGQALLCEDLDRKLVFKNHFECVSQFGPRISSCILIRTQMFRKAVTEAGITPYKTLHDITCNFAENIVNCLERPLSRVCPVEVVDTMVTALHRFLPPACAPVPSIVGDGGLHHEHDDQQRQSPLVFETVIVEGGEGDN